jgi:flagellum-specific ATP synthase
MSSSSRRAVELGELVTAGRPRRTGEVASIVGVRFDVRGLQAAVGDSVVIERTGDRGEVVSASGETLTCVPFGDVRGLRPGDRVFAAGSAHSVAASWGLLGRVLDGLGEPLDGKPRPEAQMLMPLHAGAPHPLSRQRITTPLGLGIRAWDTLMPAGVGQRVGVFAGSGVGKSSLLGMLARNASAEVNVLALIGERGREVREFIEEDLGPEGMARSVLIVATSDVPAMTRVKAAFTATAIAEFFRDQGANVLLMMDSLTRLCMAQREVGLAAGEPPATRGYPPSSFSLLAPLLERAGVTERGSITGMYTVLVEGDDANEPVSDTARSILDGHVMLSRRLAHAGHYPAIDVLSSVSRVASAVTGPERLAAASTVRQLLAAYDEARDLIDIGAYVSGANPMVDAAVAARPTLEAFLRQGINERCPAEDAWGQLLGIAGGEWR